MKRESKLKTTTNSKVYKRIHGARVSHCGWCMPHRGCNRRMGKYNRRCWKLYRENQYKEKIPSLL